MGYKSSKLTGREQIVFGFIIPGIDPYHLFTATMAIIDGIDTGLINAENIEYALKNGGGNEGYFEVYKKLNPAYTSMGLQFALNMIAASGGIYAKSARYSQIRYISIEECPSGPDGRYIVLLK